MSDRDARDAKRFGDALTLLEHRLPNGVRLVAAALVGDTAGVAAWVDEREGSDAVPTTGELEAIARHEKEKRDSIRREALEEAARVAVSYDRSDLADEIRALAAPAKEAPRCRADRCTNAATHGLDGEPTACWQHAGDWPRVECCPDCSRPKARSVGDAAKMNATETAGVFCPKWWAIRDPEADRDCERHAATKGGADGR